MSTGGRANMLLVSTWVPTDLVSVPKVEENRCCFWCT